MGDINHIQPAPMTRGERWAKEDEDRRLSQAAARHESPDAMTEAVAGYFSWKAGKALGDVIASDFDDTGSYSDD